MAKYKSRCHLPFISIIFRHYYPTSSPVRKCSIAEYTGFLCHCPWGLQAQMQLPGGIVQKHAATLYRLSPWHPYICISDYISDFSIDCSRAKCSICPCRLVGILATSQLIKWSNSKYCWGGWKAWSRGLGAVVLRWKAGRKLSIVHAASYQFVTLSKAPTCEHSNIRQRFSYATRNWFFQIDNCVIFVYHGKVGH